jgi:outer membrane immunogenic protein
MIMRAASTARHHTERLTRQGRLARIAGVILGVGYVINAAAAADLPTKAPAPPVYQWTGCYLGGNIGGGTGGSNFGSTADHGSFLGAGDAATVSGSGSGSKNAIGLVGGAQAGCNWQTGTLLLGLEGEFDSFHSNPHYNNNTNVLASGAPFSITQWLTTNYLATVQPRIGIAADRNLAYITGGVAFTSVSYSEAFSDTSALAPGPGAGTATASRSLVGWTAGAGWEYAFADHWTVRAEYLIAGFPANTTAIGTIIGPGATANTLHGSADLLVQLLRAGVNFKF